MVIIICFIPHNVVPVKGEFKRYSIFIIKLSRVNITRVVVHTDGYKGPVPEELEPISEQLSWDEVAEPGGQLLILSHHRGDVGQTWEGHHYP